MKRLSVGSQGTVDHRHRVKIQRRGGTWNFRARQFHNGEKWTKRIRPSHSTVLTKTTYMIPRMRINQLLPSFLLLRRATRDILFGGTNLISHESVYIIWKIRTRVSLVIDVHFERALLSKALHGHICTRAYVYTYARTYRPHRAGAFVSFISFISYWYISGKRCPAAISSFASTRACSICNFLYDDDVHTCTIFLRGSVACAHTPASFTAFILGFVSFRYRMFMWQRDELNVHRLPLHIPAQYSFLYQYQILAGFGKLKNKRLIVFLHLISF